MFVQNNVMSLNETWQKNVGALYFKRRVTKSSNLIVDHVDKFTMPQNKNFSGWIVVCSLGKTELLHLNLCNLVD